MCRVAQHEHRESVAEIAPALIGTWPESIKRWRVFEMINPAFIKYPEEAKLLGEIVLGYGEIDLSFAMMAGAATGQKFALLHAVNQVRSETARIDIANALASEFFTALGLREYYDYALAAVRYCLKIRNQWAHSQWGDMDPYGLAFTKTDGNVFAPPIKPTEWRSVTIEVLRKQEEYFEHTRHWILVLDTIVQARQSGHDRHLGFPAKMQAPKTYSQWSKQARDQLDKGHPHLP